MTGWHRSGTWRNRMLQLKAESPPAPRTSAGTIPADSPSSAPGNEHGRASLRPLLGIMLAGVLVRLVLWFWFQGQSPHIWDEQDYNTLAVNLVQDGEFAFTPGALTSLRPPLYPALVAGVYQLFGLENYQAVRLLQAILSLGTVVLVYRLGRELFEPRVALWAAGLCCFYPSLLGFNNLLLTEVLFTLLLCAACYAVVLHLKRGTLLTALAAGALIGLAALTRSVVWLLPPVLILFLLVLGKGGFVRRLAGAAVLVAAFVVTIAPWAVRNTKLQETFVAIDVMGGRNFMMGNYQYTPLYRSWDAIAIEGERSWVHEVQQVFPSAERSTQGKVDKLALKQGLQFVKANPGLTLHRDVIKFFDFWGLERELVAGANQGYFGPIPRLGVLAVMAIIFGSYVAVLLLGIFGLVLAPPTDLRAHWFLLLVMAFICGMHSLVFAHSRYHLPLIPLLLLYSASALVHARGVWQQRRQWKFWLASSVMGLLVAGWIWNAAAGDLQRLGNILGSVTPVLPAL